MKSKLKITLLKLSIPAVKYGLPIALLVLAFVLLRFVPAIGDKRRLFDLGSDYVVHRHGSVEVFYSPKEASTTRKGDDQNVAQWLGTKFDIFTHELEKGEFGQRLGLKLPKNRRIAIILHNSSDQYQAYWKEDPRIHIETSGRYRANDFTIGMRQKDDWELMLRTFQHETVHLLLDLSRISGGANERLPTWINEGLAQYFESGSAGGTLESYDYTDKEMVPIARLVSLDPSEFYDKEKGVHHYRESLLLVAFFLDYDKKRYRTRFLDWIRLKGRSKPILNAFTINAFGVKQEQILKEFRSFLEEKLERGRHSERFRKNGLIKKASPEPGSKGD
ncbi:MAG: hypothetical protein P1V97_23100 [Planctomycetota bacterium]|nr:hypothetical protein [Planctomycetota bacterium]